VAAAAVYIACAASDAERYAGKGVVCVLPSAQNSAAAFIDTEALHAAASGYKGKVVTEYTYRSPVTAARTVWETGPPIEQPSAVSAYARVSAVNRDYFEMLPCTFLDGGVWGENSARRAILSEALAWEMFGGIQVTGKTVSIGGEIYTITGVAGQRNYTEGGGQAWVTSGSGNEAESAGALYLKPQNYNPLDAHLSTKSLMEAMNFNGSDYVITDLSAYTEGIGARGQILLLIAVIYFIILIGRYLMALWKETLRRGKGFLISTAVSVISAALIVYMPRFFAMDLWIPAFAGEGAAAYARVFFNTGLLAPRGFLNQNLTALYDLNLYANIAAGVGAAGLLAEVMLQGTVSE
jgi:hypothetical protein